MLKESSLFFRLILTFCILVSSNGYSFDEAEDRLKKLIPKNNVILKDAGLMTNDLGFYFVSDNQFNNFLGDPQLMRTKIADRIVVVAIRPPRLDLFAPDILEHTIRKQGPDNYIIHLGDATNIACWNEWNKFTYRMQPDILGKKMHKGWVMVPGNHDFFFLGNTAGSHFRKTGGIKQTWAAACNDKDYPNKAPKRLKSRILTKGNFILAYLSELATQSTRYPRLKKDFTFRRRDAKCRKTKKATRMGMTEPKTHFEICDWEAKNPKSFLQKIHWMKPLKDDVRVEYRSLMVQEVALNPPGSKPFHYRGILLDTQDYYINPNLYFNRIFGRFAKWIGKVNPGDHGAVQKGQQELVKGWLKENNKKHDPNSTVYVFMGHHPFETILPLGRLRMGDMFNDLKYYTYVSSHTHYGYVREHKYLNKNILSELNVGSVTDWGTKGSQVVYPNQAIKNGDKITMPIFFKTNHMKKQPKDIQAFCKPEWDARNDKKEKYGYLAYNKAGWLPSAAHDRTLDLLIKAYDDMYSRLDLSKYGAKTQKDIKEDLRLRKKYDVDFKKSCGMYRKKCRRQKFLMAQRYFITDQQHYKRDKVYHEDRMKYGVCQAIWSSMQENTTW